MIRLIRNGVFLCKGKVIIENLENTNIDEVNWLLSKYGETPISETRLDLNVALTNTIAYQILTKHNVSDNWQRLRIRFDALASHDITYVSVIQTARACGLTEFSLPYILTNCHNSLCAVGGTINEDDHVFGLSASKKYGGIYVPAHQAVIHQYVREMIAGSSKMILGSDSHTRYGVLGTMGIGEGGPELVKQLLGRSYPIAYPEIIAVYLEGKPMPGVGPQDVALAIISSVFKEGFAKNKVLEFVGPGIANLSVDYRNGIDVMTTETTCLSSIWCTDDTVKEYFTIHGHPDNYSRLVPGEVAYYNGMIKVDLNKVEPMIALPFHPSNVYSISEFKLHAHDILNLIESKVREDIPNITLRLTEKFVNGKFKVDQGVVAGCSGGSFENLCLMADILENRSLGNGNFSLSVYPASQPIYLELLNNGATSKLLTSGATMRTAFCGPCFGAGDVPAHNSFSIRHTTRNFPNREGSRPSAGQIAYVALMDARSIAATAINGGFLTAATEIDIPNSKDYSFNSKVYDNVVYYGFGNAQPETALEFGPNIADWPKMKPLPENLLLKLAAVINDPITTTDELLPSGEISSFRSNPVMLAEFTLSRKDPEYTKRAKMAMELEQKRTDFVQQRSKFDINTLNHIFGPDIISKVVGDNDLYDFIQNLGIGSTIFANKPGDGSAREQAASCQKVLGGWANIAVEYATKRYRSNLINWGMLPFIIEKEALTLTVNDFIYIPNIKQAIMDGLDTIQATLITSNEVKHFSLHLPCLSDEERNVILKGSLINYYANQK